MLREIKIILHIFSRVPVGLSWDANEADIGRSLCFLPLWGLLLGLFCFAIGIIFNFVSPYLAAAAVLSASLFLSGGITFHNMVLVSGAHLIRSGRDDRWQFIKKEQISYGAVGIGISALLLKFACYLQAFSEEISFLLIPASFIFGALSLVFVVYIYPVVPESVNGMGVKRFLSRNSFLCAAGISIVLILISGDWRLMSAALIALLILIFCCRYHNRSMCGFNWESYLASWEWGEIAFLIAYYLLDIGQEFLYKIF